MIDFIREKGWNKRFWYRSKRITPKDSITYNITNGVVELTENILEQYGSLPHEGLVFWAGNIEKETINVTHVIAPETDSSEGRVTVLPESNFHVVKALSNSRIIHIGQVHTHPGSWVDHSNGDNKWASFKKNGLISLVVPRYCRNGMLPISRSGIHRFQNGRFIRLSNKYVNRHFKIIEGTGEIIDLRNKSDLRWKQQNGMI
ncbi:MAG: hypothetical protein ABJ004_12395 [Cyclobacteriaceae bacterium]